MRRLLSRALQLLVAAGVSVAPHAYAQAPRIAAFEPATTHAQDDLYKRTHGALTLRVSGVTRSFELDLVENARLLREVASATRPDGLRIMSGQVRGLAGSWARMSRIDGQWAGAIHDGGELWLLDRVDAVAGMLGAGVRAGTRSVLYRAVDVHLPGFIDRTVLAGFGMAPAIGFKGSAPERELDLALYADSRYGEIHGGNGMAFALARANVADGIFAAQAGVRIAVSGFTQLAEGAVPSYDFADGLLFRFGQLMNGPPALPQGDLTHLLTGRDVCLFDMMGGCVPGSQSVAGIANQLDTPGGIQGVLCHPTQAYALSEAYSGATVFALITAHELGHNFGAPHDGEAGSACAATPPGDWLMKPALDGNDATLSPCSLATIADDIAGASCLRMLEPPLFADGFES